MSDGLHKLVFKFINNRNFPQLTCEYQEFREIIDYCIKNAGQLKDHKHMGKRRFVSVQCATFADFLGLVESEIIEIREYYIEQTVRL